MPPGELEGAGDEFPETSLEADPRANELSAMGKSPFVAFALGIDPPQPQLELCVFTPTPTDCHGT